MTRVLAAAKSFHFHSVALVAMTILFVCSGNTCRSPLAVAAWRHLQKHEANPLREITVLSAGLQARKGAPVSSQVAAVAQNWNVNLEAHRARVLAPALLQRAHLVCPMTLEQARHIRAAFPNASAPIVPLGRYEIPRGAHDAEKLSEEERRFRALLEWEGDSEIDIADPFGASRRVYRECGARITRCVRGLRIALRDGSVSNFSD